MLDLNVRLVRDWQASYKEFFRILQQEGNAPLLFHCSAGKDRTGFGAMLFLLGLGVDRQTVIDDYLLSAQYLKNKYASMLKEKPDSAPMLTVYREYIETALAEIDRNYGGVENYLANNLGVDLKLLRKLYTE